MVRRLRRAGFQALQALRQKAGAEILEGRRGPMEQLEREQPVLATRVTGVAAPRNSAPRLQFPGELGLQSVQPSKKPAKLDLC